MKIAAWTLGSLLVIDALYLVYLVMTSPDWYAGVKALPYALVTLVPLFLVFLAVLTVHVSRARPPSRRS